MIGKSIQTFLNHFKTFSWHSPSIYDSMRHMLSSYQFKFNIEKGIVADDKQTEKTFSYD